VRSIPVRTAEEVQHLLKYTTEALWMGGVAVAGGLVQVRVAPGWVGHCLPLRPWPLVHVDLGTTAGGTIVVVYLLGLAVLVETRDTRARVRVRVSTVPVGVT